MWTRRDAGDGGGGGGAIVIGAEGALSFAGFGSATLSAALASPLGFSALGSGFFATGEPSVRRTVAVPPAATATLAERAIRPGAVAVTVQVPAGSPVALKLPAPSAV